MTLSKEEIRKRFNQLSSIESEEEHYQNEAMMLHYRIIQLVEAVMEKNHWNKKQLAQKLDKSQSYITQLFTGSKMVNMQMLARLQDALEFSFKFETEEKNERFIPWKCLRTLPSENEKLKRKEFSSNEKSIEKLIKDSPTAA